MSTLVYVFNHNGHPLMPCTPAKARKLLRDGKARLKQWCPFTIQLAWDCEEHVQEVVLGIDKGSHATGFCCVSRGKILLSGEIHHRQDVKARIDDRRANRKAWLLDDARGRQRQRNRHHRKRESRKCETMPS